MSKRLDLSGCQIVHAPMAKQPGLAMMAEIPVGGESWTLDLRPHSVRADSYAVYLVGANGVPIPAAPGPVTTMRGTVVEYPGSHVIATMLEGGLEAMIDLGDGSGRRWLEPVAAHVDAAGPDLYALFHDDDVQRPEGTCGTTDEHLDLDAVDDAEPAAANGGGLLGSGFCTTELACDADYDFYFDYGQNQTSVTNRINSVINLMNDQYEEQLGITHVITTIMIRTSAGAGGYTSFDAGTLLDQFRSNWIANHTDVDRDIAHLFTGKSLNGTTIGIAWLAVICANPFGGLGYSLVENISPLGCATDLSAHELGHNWSATHCSCPTFTMNSGLTCANEFNAGSISEITAHKNSRTCLDCAPFLDYCEATDNTSSGEHINLVTLGSLSNPSGQGNYSDFTGQVVELIQGQNYTLTVGIGSPNSTDIGGAWIDHNADNDLTDPVDYITSSSNWSGTGPYQVSFQVLGFDPGLQRMRVRIQRGSQDPVVLPCGDTTRGEVEDYTVMIVAPEGACCFTNGSCSGETLNDCWGTGGIYLGNFTQCSPNPCNQPTGACCFEDGSCQLMASSSCAAASGEYEGDGTSCQSTNCPTPMGACCITSNCIELSSGDCAEAFGTYDGDGSVCDAGSCVAPTGACCIFGFCFTFTAPTCIQNDGEYLGDGTACSQGLCAIPTGACCYSDGSCLDQTGPICGGGGGVYNGDGSGCQSVSCPQPTAACCFSDGGCSTVTANACTTSGGTFQGVGSGCVPNNCPPPTGACCLANGSCFEDTSGDCTAASGTYQGNLSTCASASCPQPGACCIEDGSCQTQTGSDCQSMGGTYQGNGTVCTEANCPQPCDGDFDQSGDVGFSDLTDLLIHWGTCPPPPCPWDLDGNSAIGFGDLTIVLIGWGPC